MGSCLSKPAGVDQPVKQQVDVQNERLKRREDAVAEPTAAAVVAVKRDQQASPELPAELTAWTATDVEQWAASLGLPNASLTALKGIGGQQLLQVTDQRLLQLGVQDAAERHALLSARQHLQQQHDSAAAKLQQAGGTIADGKAAVPHFSDKGIFGSVQRPNAAGTGVEELGLVADAQPDTPSTGAKALGRHTTMGRPQGQADVSAAVSMELSSASGNARPSDDNTSRTATVSESNVLLEEMQDMQVLRITANGRLFRHSRAVPLSLVPYCQALCLLHDLRRGAHYHYDNCHQLLQRCVLVQDYLLALPHSQLQQHTVMLAQLSLLVQDAYDVFSQFSERGWLLRLLNSVRDSDDFNRLDRMLVSAVEAAGADTSEPPLAELKRAHMYAPQQQQLELALKHLGGITKLLRDPLSATVRLQSLLHHLPSGSNIDTLLQQEIDHYLSSQLWFSDSGSRPGSRENSFNRGNSTGSGGSNGGVGRANSGGSIHNSSGGGGVLRRQSSLGPGRRAATLSVVEPFMVLRNDTVRSEWRAAFGGRERVSWKEFWYKLVQPQAHIWGLDQQLDKFTTDYVQQHLQRGSHGLLTIAELDFAFPPNSSPAMVIQAKLKEHSTSNTSLPNVTLLTGPSGGAKLRTSNGAAGWLRDVRVLQEPIPRLHNFPEFPPFCLAREEEIAELALNMADVSTNLVMLTGPQGVGRSMLAASLAQELVVSHHWTDAYWIDLQGVTNVVLAGQQLMTGLGLTSDVPDTQQLLAWLEGRPRERFGIVLTHVQELLSASAEEQQGFLDLLDNILHSSHKLQVVVVCEEALSRITYLARTVEVEPLAAEVASQMVQQAQPDISEDLLQMIVEACQGAPVALAVVCNLIRYGHCNAADFVRIYSDPSLPIERTVSDVSSSSYLPYESRQTHERLQRLLVAAAVALPDDLVTGLLVLSLLPAPFSFEMAAPLLALPATNNERRAILRRLVNIGLLSYNASLQLYTMHKLVRDAARLLVHNLGLPYAETRRRFAELLVSSARRLVLPLIAKNRMLSARLAWSRLSVHVVQLLNWAFTEVKEDMLPLYVSLAWDLMPLLTSSCSSHTLQGFCQVVVERAQFLDLNLESAQVMTVLASLLAESGALKRADTMLRQALEYFWRELKGPHPAVARCYRELGSLMLKAGKPSEATKHLQQALEMLEQLFGGASTELLPVLQLQVELMRRSRKYAEAESVVTRALGICGAAFGPNDVQVAVWKNQLAQVVRQAGRLEEAQSLAQEVLALLQGQLGSEHPRVAAQLMMLGQLAAQQGKQAAAEQAYRKALQVYQSVSGLHHPDTFNCLTSLVSLLRGAGKASHALPLAQRLMAVKKKSLGELHPDTAASMQVVADVMLDLGKYAEVESHCGRAVWVYQQLNQPPSSKPVIVATTMQALALVLLGRANEAEQLATNCLKAAKLMSGPAAERNSFVASCYNCLGEVLREMGRLTDAENAAREGLSMREKDLGANHPIVAISLQTLGHILRMRQALDEALDVAKRCEQLRASQPQSLQMAAALHLEALIYLDQGKLSEALAAGQAALTIRQKMLSNEHPDLAHSLTVVSEVLLMQDKHTEAEPLLSHAVQTFIAQLGSSHPATQRAHTLLKQATNPRTSTISSMRLSGLRLVSGVAPVTPAIASPTSDGSVDMAEQSADAGGSSRRVTNTADAAGADASGPPAEATQPEGSAVAEQEQQAVTVPETDTTDLAPAVEEAAAMAAEEAGAGQDEGATTAQPEIMLLAPVIPSPAVPSSPSNTTNAANISIASRINNIALAASGSYGGYMSMGMGSPTRSTPVSMGSPSKVATVQEEDEPQLDLQPHKTAAAAQELAAAGAPVGRTASGAPSEDAPAPADPSEWELGRQFGQAVAAGQGELDDADAGARAYTKVLHELTRRTSFGSHDGGRDTLVSAASDASAAAAAAAKPADGRLATASTTVAPAASASASVAGETGAAAAGVASETGSVLKESVSEDTAAELEAAAVADEDDKLAKLHGVGDIEQLRQFLREHGWQLSRLSRSDERDAPSNATRANWIASRNAAVASAYSAAAANGAKQAGRSVAAAELRQRLSPQDASAAAGAQGDGGSGSQRRPPARHYSFLNRSHSGLDANGLGLESVQEVSSGQLQAVQAAEAAAAAAQGGALEQQQRMQAQYMQSQHSMPEMAWGPEWQLHEGIMEAEAAADVAEQYQQRLAQQEAVNRLRAEQGWLANQQMRSRGMFGTTAAATVGSAELTQRLMQLRQLYGMDAYSDEDIIAAMHSSQLPAYSQQHQQQGHGARRRRDSWDASYGHGGHPMAQAAAAAAAACGYDVSATNGSGELQTAAEAYQQHLQLHQQHSAGNTAWQQQAGMPGMSMQQQQHDFMTGGSSLSPLQTSWSTPQQQQVSSGVTSRAQVGFYPGGVSAKPGHNVQQPGQQSGGIGQYSPLSPAGSAAPAELAGQSALLGSRGAGMTGLPGAGVAGLMLSGTLAKYPSNISNYSAGSARSVGRGQAEQLGEVQGADGESAMQQSGQSREGFDQQQQQQYSNTVAAMARNAINLGRQGSSGALQGMDASGPSSSIVSARSDGVTSPTTASGGAGSSTGRPRYKRNVSFKLNKQQLNAALQGQLDASEHADGNELNSPVAAATAAGTTFAGGAGMAMQQQWPSRPVSRPRSPLVHGMDQQQVQQLSHHSPHASLTSNPMMPDSPTGESIEAYYEQQQQLRTPVAGAYGIPRPPVATTPAGAQQQQQQQRTTAFGPAAGVSAQRGPPSAARNRSFNSLQMGSWDSNDPARAHQQLLLQQQVLQVQAARLELQQQQLEIEQLLSQQQQEQAAVQWAPAVQTPASMGQGQQRTPQQQQQQQQYYQQQQHYAVPNYPGYPALQPTASVASTVSLHSPAGSMQHTQRGGMLEPQQTDGGAASAAAAPTGHPGNVLPPVSTGPSPQSSMLTAGSTYVPSSPSASSSLSSRPALSRGTSDNQEAQVAAAMAAQMSTAAGSSAMAAAAAAAAAARAGGMPGQQQQRPGSPDRMKRAASGNSQGVQGTAGASSAGFAGRQLHRLHTQRSYDEVDASTVPGAAGHPGMSAALPAGSQIGGAAAQQHGQQNQQGFGWQAQQQQQQMLLQQLALQQHQTLQQQVPFSSRMGPARMQQYNTAGALYPPMPVSGPAQGIGFMGGPQTVAGNASGPLGITRGSFMPQSGMFSGPLVGIGRQMAGPAAIPPAPLSARGHSAYPVNATYAGRADSHGMQSAHMAHPSFPSQHPAVPWQQQHDYYTAAAAVPQAMDSQRYGAPGSPDRYAVNAQQQGMQGGDMQQQGSEDYEMWATAPDYGAVGGSFAQDSSGPSGQLPSRGESVSRSFIAPGGGQYWMGRRSNSFGNLQEGFADGVGSPARAGGMVRSRSSSELIPPIGEQQVHQEPYQQ